MNDTRDLPMYSNCISLGWFCGTASAMSKYGLRSYSGPFDWYFSDLKSVITLIDTGFSDFLDRNNLIIDKDNDKRFYDSKYGFLFFHEIKSDLDSDYEEIRSRYRRRIERFLELSKEPTIFLRAVRTVEEKEYISTEFKEIDRVIKKGNPGNIIVFLTTDKIGKLSGDVISFDLNVESYAFDAASLRGMFDNAPELINFCTRNMDEECISQNMRFDSDSNSSRAAEIIGLIREGRREVADGIRELFNLGENEGIYLWGIGYHGKAMFLYLKKMGIVVRGLLDSKLYGEQYERFTVGSYDSVPCDAKILITIADKISVGEVRRLIESKCPTTYDYQQLYSKINELKNCAQDY